MMRRRPGRWILGGIAAICLSLAVVLTLTLTAFSQLEASRAAARQASDELAVIRQLFTAIQDAETGQRGYLLARDQAYLEPYLSSLGRITERRAELQTYADANPMLRERLRALSEQIDIKLNELQRTIDISKAEGFDAAQAALLANGGKEAMDTIRSLVDDMVKQSESDLQAGRIKLNESIERSRFIGVLAGALALLVAIFGGVGLYRAFLKLKTAEAKLREQAGLLQTTLDNTGEGVAAFDPVHGLIAWNPRFFTFAGYPDDFPRFGRTSADFLAFDRQREERLFETEDGHDALDGVEQMTKLKSRVRIGGRDLECAHKRTITGGVVMTCSDVTERIRIEQVARQAQKMEAIGQLTGGVAHDFNNLLQILASNLDLMSRHLQNPEVVAKHIKYASAATERGAKLTRQLLAFARRQPLEPVVVNLGKRVRAMSDLLHRTLGETIEIETIVDAGLWNSFVDVNQVENAILNLAVNARDAMPEGGKLTIELANAVLDEKYARLHEEVRAGQYVMLAVTDTGSGMPPDVAARAFEPFFTTKPEGQGTGLGLSMVYGFVKQSSGHAKIYSEPGLGTTIRIYLPRSRRPEELLAAVDREPARGNEHILLVEDDEEVRRAVAEMTRGLGYHVIEAKDGAAALALLRNGTRVDLLFTDVVMSGAVSGRDLARAAQQMHPHLAVLFTSGYTENAIIHHGRLDEGVHLLSKPYREPELSTKLRAVLEEQALKNRRSGTPGGIAPEGIDGSYNGSKAHDNKSSGGAAMNERAGLAILLVDDDALIRLATAEMLADLGHHVTEVGRGEEALVALRNGTPIDVMVVDLTLPDMDGADMVARATGLLEKTGREKLRVVFASGRNIGPVGLDSTKVQHVALPKPYDIDQLAAALAKVAPTS
jgi:signal transduction histidine kinase/CHASE3 domain sensor protein/DNA-binding response OmpR family regulator